MYLQGSSQRPSHVFKSEYFQHILDQGTKMGVIDRKRSEAASEFLRSKGRNMRPGVRGAATRTGNANRLFELAEQHRKKGPSPGSMFLFKYDAKYKDVLPYWDSFPLVFPIEMYSDGFLAINLHYVPPNARAKIMDALWSISNSKKFDEKTKIKLTYAMLTKVKKFKPLQFCLKRYLYSHVKTPPIEIFAPEWDIVLFMPLAKWNNSSVSSVYKDYQYSQ